jgi:ubiquinone/menaquinone biosynthesis C-methylase UbiE
MKLHIGCGPIYLKDYINIDVKADFIYPNVPEDIFKNNLTTFGKYYKHEFGKGSAKTVVDLESDICNLSFSDESIDEIILMHILEHIPLYDLHNVLIKIKNMLKINGCFIVGVPDIKGSAKMLVDAKTKEEEDWAIRLIHGTQRNKFCHHFCGYTESSLLELLDKYGFGNFKKLKNINFYPALHFMAFKK